MLEVVMEEVRLVFVSVIVLDLWEQGREGGPMISVEKRSTKFCLAKYMAHIWFNDFQSPQMIINDHLWTLKIIESYEIKYPLVISHSYWTWPFIVSFPIKKWWFSIVMLVYQEGKWGHDMAWQLHSQLHSRRNDDAEAQRWCWMAPWSLSASSSYGWWCWCCSGVTWWHRVHIVLELGLEFDKELTMHQMHHHKFRLDVTWNYMKLWCYT